MKIVKIVFGFALLMLATLSGCKDKENDITIVEVKNITLDKTELTMNEGESATLVATITPNEAGNKTLTWESGNPEFVTVDNTGKVVAVKEGSAVITVKSSNNIKATCNVTVTTQTISVTSVSLDETALVLAVGGKHTFNATVKPDNAANKKVIWSSNNTPVATVNEDGEVTAIEEGTATITATTEDGGKTVTCAITVTLTGEIEVTDITLDNQELSMILTTKVVLTATITPANATDKTITWSSSDEDVATVTDGEVKALKAGTAAITATAGEKTATSVVTVSGTLGKVSINGGDEITYVTSLLSEKITGLVTKIVFGEGSELDGSDIKAMMNLKASLEHLDMTEATIVSGGEPYIDAGRFKIPIYTSQFEIGDEMFNNMEKLKAVLLPANTKTIKDSFIGCTEITGYNIPEGVTFITSPFRDARMESLTLPASINFADGSVRYDVGAFGFLDNIYVAEGNNTANSVEGVVYSLDGKELYMLPRNRTSYSVPEGVTVLQGNCFNHSRLTSISLPASLTTIRESVFNSTALTTLTIPANVEKMGYRSISNNHDLTTIIVNATVPPEATSEIREAFVVDNNKLSAIYVLDESVEAYKAADRWQNNAAIIKPISDMP